MSAPSDGTWNRKKQESRLPTARHSASKHVGGCLRLKGRSQRAGNGREKCWVDSRQRDTCRQDLSPKSSIKSKRMAGNSVSLIIIFFPLGFVEAKLGNVSFLAGRIIHGVPVGGAFQACPRGVNLEWSQFRNNCCSLCRGDVRIRMNEGERKGRRNSGRRLDQRGEQELPRGRVRCFHLSLPWSVSLLLLLLLPR